MNIVTIFEYDIDKPNYLIMLHMLVHSIKIHCVKYPYKLWIITKQQNKIDQLFNDTNIITMSKESASGDFLPNIKNKLFYLTHLDFEFIYIDCDMYVCEDLSYLWDRRNDKPFISVFHQPNIKGHTDKQYNFMNSGLQIVSDNSFLNFNNIMQMGYKRNFEFDVSGTDQALLHHYFSDINYDYCHKDIGYEWNSCAGYGQVDIDSNYNFNITYKNNTDEYKVKINHYWDQFKPWNINCPIFNFYKKLV
jgi:hypothetical protein